MNLKGKTKREKKLSSLDPYLPSDGVGDQSPSLEQRLEHFEEIQSPANL